MNLTVLPWGRSGAAQRKKASVGKAVWVPVLFCGKSLYSGNGDQVINYRGLLGTLLGPARVEWGMQLLDGGWKGPTGTR